MGVLTILIACLWPVIAIAYVIYTGNHYIAEHPGEVNDAPAMVLMGVISFSPFIFLGGLSLALLGLYMGRRIRKVEVFTDSSLPNKRRERTQR